MLPEVGDTRADQRDALVDVEQRPLLRVVQDTDDEPIEEAGGTLGDVEMRVRHRVERAGKDRHSRHASASLQEGEHRFPEPPLPGGGQPRDLGRLGAPEVLDHDRCGGRQMRHEGAKRRHDSTHLVRWIQHRDVPLAFGGSEKALDVQLVDRSAPVQPRPLEVRAQCLDGAPVALDEVDVLSPARQRLDPDRPAARVEV